MAGLEDIAPVLDELADGLKTLYGKRFVGLMLFGSYARGEAKEGSDVDLLLLLHGPVDALAEIHRSEEVAWPLSLVHDLTLSLLPVNTEQSSALGSSFLTNLEHEGVRVEWCE
ncbi:nucleotidyltransferase domain-containing protein [soil metagenome]